MIGGRVSAIDHNRGGVWLELDEAVVLQVPARLQRAFPDGFFDNLKGRQVEARGWVLDRSRKGGLKPGQRRWLLPLSDPSMLEQVSAKNSCRHYDLGLYTLKAVSPAGCSVKS